MEINTMLKGYRTFIASTLMAIFGVLAIADWNAFLDNPQAGIVAIGSAILMAILRVFTTTPPGVSGKETAKE